MKARVTGSATNGQTWRGTQYRWGDNGRQCVNTDDKSGTDKTVEFNVTAAGDPGNYDAGFTARSANDCGGDESAEKVLTDALRVTTPGPNPNLPPRCGINVMLVLDKSGSIASSGATEAVRNATRAFLAALSGTGAKVSITDFSSTAKWQVGYTTVTLDTIAGVFEPYLEDVYNPSGWTNWEDAFKTVHGANTQGTKADLVVFVTDGDPTARNTPSGPETGLTEGDVEALRPAAAEADRVKAQGSHVLALGVGAAVTKPTSARRLTAISGFNEYPGTEFGKADYTLVQNFADLAARLRAIAVELCKSSVIVTKKVDEGDGVYRPDPGWQFTASVSTSSGDYTWLQPAPPPDTGPRSETTNDDGVATFQWDAESSDATSTVDLREQVKAGYDFVDASCTTTAYRRKRRRVVRRVQSTDPTVSVSVGPNQFAKCTVRNRIRPGTIEIEKSANPEGRQEFAFSGSLGDFTLVDYRQEESASSRTFAGLVPGTYTVRELVPENWELTGVTCSDPAVVVAGPEAAITIGPGDSVVCTYRDTRVEPPAPPEPPTPPTPPTPPVPPVPPTPPTPPPGTQLRVVKTAPRAARVGTRIRFRLTVTNVGSVAARSVVMADVPPAAVALAALKSRTRGQVVQGNAVWRLGTLAPGAKRTVSGTVRIKAGTPGLKRNLVLATAANANLARDRADTRVRARQRVSPVTG